MRTIRLLPLMAAATAALVLAPASALARRQAQATRACHIRLDAQAPLAAGEAATIVGQLKCPGQLEPGEQQVTLYERPALQSTFTALSPVTSEKSGAFQVKLPVLETSTTVYALAEGAKSAQRTIRVAAQVTPEAPTPAEGAQLITGDGGRLQSPKRVDFAGTVKPYYVGERVVLQRESSSGNEEWRAIQIGVVKAGGKYLFEHRFLVPGEANIRVVAHPKKLNAPAASTPSSYEISQVQNSQLTLVSAVDPVSFGQSVTLKGIVSGAKAETPITLYERNAGGQLTPVAPSHTASDGSYEFTRTPAQNTIFQVRSGAAKSALVFEGVKHQLTFTPPASSVVAGQPLDFSGSVLPAGPVYLERQNAGQLGWHVIDSSAPASSFLIAHVFGTAGVERLRIKVPGGDGHQAIASVPFEVTVTAAPASALTPQAPGNTPRLPAEGQV
jgi:hypothetical protein